MGKIRNGHSGMLYPPSPLASARRPRLSILRSPSSAVGCYGGWTGYCGGRAHKATAGRVPDASLSGRLGGNHFELFKQIVDGYPEEAS